jgi:hypothetical protein
MQKQLLIAIASVVFLASCGGGGSSTTRDSSQDPQFADLSGNWSITATSQFAPPPGLILGGSFSQDLGAVSGIIRMLSYSCYNPLQTAFTISGTLTTNENVNLTASAPDGGKISISGTATPDGSSITGTYSISGGCADGDKGSVQATRIPPITGTYTGAFTSSSDGSKFQVIANLSQGTGSGKQFGEVLTGSTEISGKAQITGSPCFTTATTDQGMVLGPFIYAEFTGPNGNLVVQGAVSNDGRQIKAGYFVDTGNCAGDQGQGTLSR